MIAGYLNEYEQVLYTACWRARAASGARPPQIVDTEDPYDPGSNFWVVDSGTGCARHVKYKAAMALN